ncbi:pentapeptide repeat-containing protein [Pseudochelatococcus sp. B33]
MYCEGSARRREADDVARPGSSHHSFRKILRRLWDDNRGNGEQALKRDFKMSQAHLSQAHLSQANLSQVNLS